ncbi:MAG: Asp-tRNA(Asn)/Glu-tRNA(Gln) amidotransferase subunit GatC [Nitrospinaceae bacterium]
MSGKFDIDHIAQLARLKLTDSEKERLGGHLDTIIEYIGQLDQLDTSNVEPTSHVLPIRNVFRDDEAGAGLPRRDYLSLAPSQKKDHYEVPKII